MYFATIKPMFKHTQKGIGVVMVILILLVLGIGGYAGWKVWGSKADSNSSEQNSIQSDSSTENSGAQNTEPEKASTGAVITTGDSEFGTMLFNDKGQAIYIWELEESTKAECYGDCAEAWPPVLTDGSPRAAGSVSKDLLGTTQRTDGSTQVTYNGHPLYYYAHEKAGEVKCHNIRTHGGLWWVIQPSGIRAS
jgi:predicted lipoprotein with Yx(FWY)xxD motif